MVRIKSFNIFVLVLLSILFIGLVNAEPIISGFNLEYGSIPITSISLTNPITVHVGFEVHTDRVPEMIQVNFSDLTRNIYYKEQYKNMKIYPNSCEWKNQTNTTGFWKCGILDLLIHPESANVNLGFIIVINSTNSTTEELSHTFDVDSDGLNLESITTDYCYENKCYVKNGIAKMYFDFDDGSEQFIRKAVYYYFNNQKVQVRSCVDGSCFGINQQSCNTGDSFNVKLVTSGQYQSQDDAGNPIISNVEENIYCDSKRPFDEELGSNITVIANSDYGLNLGNEPLDIVAYVHEDGPVLYGQVNLSSIGGEFQRVACIESEVSGLFECHFDVARLINTNMQASPEFEFFDVVNYSSGIIEPENPITILKSVGTNVTTPNCIEIDVKQFMPKKINRIALDLAATNSISYPLYGPFIADAKSGSSCRDIQIQEQAEAPECWVIFTNGTKMNALNFFDINVEYPYNQVGDKNHISLSPTTAVNLYDTNYKIECNLSFIISDDEKLYGDPLIVPVEWSIEFVNSAFDRPGKAYTQQLKDFEERSAELHNKALDIANTAYATVNEICTAKNYLDLAGGSVTVAKNVIAAAGAAAIGTGVGNVVLPALEPPYKVVAGVKIATNVGSSEGITGLITDGITSGLKYMNMICGLSTCPIGKEYEKFMQDTLGEGGVTAFLGTDSETAHSSSSTSWTNGEDGATFGDVVNNEVFGGIALPKLENSLIMSTATLCLPGIVYQLHQIREIDCEYMYCLKRNAQYGMGIDACKDIKSTFWCKKVIGEIFELPFVRLAKNLAANLNNIAQNFIPKIGLNLLTKAACTSNYISSLDPRSATLTTYIGTGGLLQSTVCEIPMSIAKIIRGQKMASGAGSGFFAYPNNADICALAMCNEEDETQCEHNAGLFSSALKDTGLVDVLDSSHMTADDYRRMLQSNNRMNNKKYFDTVDRYSKSTDPEQKEKLKNVLINDYGLKDETVLEGSTSEDRRTPKEIRKDFIDYYIKSEQEASNTPYTIPDNYDGPEGFISPNDGTESSMYSDWLNGKTTETTMNELETEMWEEVKNYKGKDQEILASKKYLAGKVSENEGAQVLYSEQINANLEKVITNLRKNIILDEQDEQRLRNCVTNGFKGAGCNNFEFAKGDIYKLSEYDEMPKSVQEATQVFIDSNPHLFKDEDYIFESVDGEPVLDNEKIEKLHNCVTNGFKGAGCSEFSGARETINNKIQLRRNNEAEHKKWLNVHAKMVMVIDWGVQLLWNSYLKDNIGATESLGEWGQGISDLSNRWLNPEGWKNSICNPRNDLIVSHGTDAVLDCTGSSCKPILTMVVEKTAYNWTDGATHENVDTYLYTFAYLVGPAKKDFTYELSFKEFNGNKYCVTQDDHGNCRMHDLPEGENLQNSLAFTSTNNYEKMCFKFDKIFPGTESGETQDTFCRTIVGTEASAWHTGEPDLQYGEEGYTGPEGNEGESLIFG